MAHKKKAHQKHEHAEHEKKETKHHAMKMAAKPKHDHKKK